MRRRPGFGCCATRWLLFVFGISGCTEPGGQDGVHTEHGERCTVDIRRLSPRADSDYEVLPGRSLQSVLEWADVVLSGEWQWEDGVWQGYYVPDWGTVPGSHAFEWRLAPVPGASVELDSASRPSIECPTYLRVPATLSMDFGEVATRESVQIWIGTGRFEEDDAVIQLKGIPPQRFGLSATDSWPSDEAEGRPADFMMHAGVAEISLTDRRLRGNLFLTVSWNREPVIPGGQSRYVQYHPVATWYAEPRSPGAPASTDASE